MTQVRAVEEIAKDYRALLSTELLYTKARMCNEMYASANNIIPTAIKVARRHVITDNHILGRSTVTKSDMAADHLIA